MKRLLVIAVLLLSLFGCGKEAWIAPEITAIRAYDAHGLFTVKFVAYSDASLFDWIIDGVAYQGHTAIHTYNEPGDYTVELTVSNAQGASTTEVFPFTLYYNRVCFWDPIGTPQLPGGAWTCTFSDDRPGDMRIMENE